MQPRMQSEIAEANEVFENELDELGEGENDPDGEDDPMTDYNLQIWLEKLRKIGKFPVSPWKKIKWQ